MKEFLSSTTSLLRVSLPGGDVSLGEKPGSKQRLWDFLEAACTGRQWSPGKTFLSFNISSTDACNASLLRFGNASDASSERFGAFAIGRELRMYDADMHRERVIFFSGHEKNRLLTHFYSYLFFPDKTVEKLAKTFVRDRMRVTTTILLLSFQCLYFCSYV